MATTFAG